ncbi:MAG: hypothetical protein RJB38_1796 [Pseudomonadota bacterium]|jgi:hypothetical protein
MSLIVTCPRTNHPRKSRNLLKLLNSITFVLTVLTLSNDSALAKTASSPKWDYWYTVTILPNHRYSYYHEQAELTKGRIHFKTEIWKNEEGFINSEQLGSFSEDNADLKPLFYHFHANYRSSEVSIDGTANGGRLQIRITKNGQEAPVITKGLSGKAFFSSIFPVWLQRQLLSVPAQQALSFSKSFVAMMEDHQDSGFASEPGRFQVIEGDDYSKASKTVKVQVEFAGQRSFWYLDSGGAPTRIDIPTQRTRVQRSTEKEAKAFLNAP